MREKIFERGRNYFSSLTALLGHAPHASPTLPISAHVVRHDNSLDFRVKKFRLPRIINGHAPVKRIVSPD
jgi:hypothetical protein